MLLIMLFSFFQATLLITAKAISSQDFKNGNMDRHSGEDPKQCSIESDFCSPWVYCGDGECKCGEIPDPGQMLRCHVGKNLSVLASNCATYDEKNGVVETGKCLYNMVSIYDVYTTLPTSISNLDGFMCGKLFNRTGTLCGKCKDGHYPLVYSFDMNCIQCPNGKANWWKYVLAAYLPLTAFYLVVLTFKINVASSSLVYPFVVYAQGISFPINARVELLYLMNDQTAQTATRWITMIYGIWNLESGFPLIWGSA